jgi:hypothetical protein
MIHVYGYPRCGNSLLMVSLWLTYFRQACAHYHDLRGAHFANERGDPPSVPDRGIVIVREPAAALRSLWRMRRWWGLDAPSFAAFLERPFAASWQPGPEVHLVCNLGDGPHWVFGRNDAFAGVHELPLAHIERYQSQIQGARQIRYEQLVSDPAGQLARIADWFCLPPSTPTFPEVPVGYDVQVRPRLSSVVWWVTMGCNFKCEYCWEVQAQRKGEFMPIKMRPWQDWLEVWQRLAPRALDITGGEPFLLAGLEQLLAALPAEMRFGLTTNLSHPIDELVHLVPPERFVQLTCSFHPTQGHRLPPELFLGRALRLLHRGYPVVINIVGWPDCLYRARDWIGHFQHHGLRVHFDPYYSMYDAMRFSEEERAIAHELTGPDRLPPTLSELPQVYCSGGLDHLSVQPDGSAWRCILETQHRLNPLGNVFDASFSLATAPLTCAMRRDCPGCDRDKVTVAPG